MPMTTHPKCNKTTQIDNPKERVLFVSIKKVRKKAKDAMTATILALGCKTEDGNTEIIMRTNPDQAKALDEVSK